MLYVHVYQHAAIVQHVLLHTTVSTVHVAGTGLLSTVHVTGTGLLSTVHVTGTGLLSTVHVAGTGLLSIKHVLKKLKQFPIFKKKGDIPPPLSIPPSKYPTMLLNTSMFNTHV